MPTQINQIDDPENSRTVLRVDGEMNLEDARLLEKIASDIRSESQLPVIIDLAELDLMDSDAASVLKRMQTEGFKIEGVEIFLQTAINETERQKG
jgi:anti-anti-sigma factor